MKKINFLLVTSLLCFSALYAKSWHFESIHIKATINADGSMHVHEERNYNFRGQFRWADYSLSGLEKQTIQNFNLKDTFDSYIENESEDDGTYYTETGGNQFYVRWHYRARNEIKTFYLDYTVTNVVKTYDDVAELYWKFIGETNPEWVDSVSIEISLPQKASFGEVKAWAHGPLWGNVKFTDSNILLTLSGLPEE